MRIIYKAIAISTIRNNIFNNQTAVINTILSLDYQKYLKD